MTSVTSAPPCWKELIRRGVWFVAGLLLCLGIFFRIQIASGFDRLNGDSYDAVIVVAILEHWFNTFQGWSDWRVANYFYPYQRTLGHTDGYFLFGVVYSLLRWMHIEPFLASELTNAAGRAFAYAAFFWAARRMFQLDFRWALLGAVLFVLANSLSVHGQRLQFASIGLAPLLAVLLWNAWDALLRGDRVVLATHGAAFAILFGAWSITCFYMAWFFGFFLMVFVPIAAVLAGRDQLALAFRQAGRQILVLLGVAVVGVLSVAPLLHVYLFKAKQTGMRPFETVFRNTVPWESILQIGTENYVLGGLYNAFLHVVSPSYTPNGEYYNTGFSLPMALLFALGAILAFRLRRSVLVMTCALATGVIVLLTMRFGSASLWTYVFQFVPGARALSVVTAYLMFLVGPVVMVGMFYLHHRFRPWNLAAWALLAVALIAVELNSGYVHLDRKAEIRRIQGWVPAPAECHSFFVTALPGQSLSQGWAPNHYAHNVTAMLIAELARIPTINGIASFNPPDWMFAHPTEPEYMVNVRGYVAKHNLSNVCQLDLRTLRWATHW